MGCCESAEPKPQVPVGRRPSKEQLRPQAPTGTGNKAVLGPVIGSVTATTARVMYEFHFSDGRRHEVTLSVQGAGGKVSVTKECESNLPVVFSFPALREGTRYRILPIENVWCPIEQAGFRTRGEGGDPLTFAVVSCNKALVMREIATSGMLDLWDDMAQRAEAGDIDVIIHLGDQIYADEVDQGIEGGDPKSCYSRMLTKLHKPGAKWIENNSDFTKKNPERKDAVMVLDGEVRPESEWESFRSTIEKAYRECYYETWQHLPCRRALANASNVMLYDDHDISDDWGDRSYHRTGQSPGTPEAFIGSIAMQMYHEYQKQLRTDIVRGVGKPIQPWNSVSSYESEGFATRWGDVGALFIDMRGPRSFRCPQDQLKGEPPLVDEEQWQLIESSLAQWQDVKHVMFCTPVPVCLFTEAMTRLGARFVNDCAGQFAFSQKDALIRLLDMLDAWRTARPDREVTVYAGDIHIGQLTNIYNKDKDTPAIRQMIASSVGNHGAGKAGQLVMKMMGDMGSEISDKWSFSHHSRISADRNYGLVRVRHYDGGRVEVTHEHVQSKQDQAMIPKELLEFTSAPKAGRPFADEPGAVTSIGRGEGARRWTHIAGIGMPVSFAVLFSPGEEERAGGDASRMGLRGETVFNEPGRLGIPKDFKVSPVPVAGADKWEVRYVKGEVGNFVVPADEYGTSFSPFSKDSVKLGEFWAEKLPCDTAPADDVVFVRWRHHDAFNSTLLSSEPKVDSAWKILWAMRRK
eukprot:TRINITY_DN13346_c0_g2_i1.p1 TRINITY_DN13346_c0_g2~~TRINITY_DN13346_c0_g2_i1.p1  ORF type:complete len:768 (+),score=266.63 TRINITY_DN13346_c0_g2_i1:65-2305(+)